ncbi:MAG: signal peptidase I [Candidatus Gracilibacteria bacterium]|jgi:signal peptidase I
MKEKSKKILLWIADFLVNLIVIFILVMILQKWIVAPFDVYGPSMCNTLNFLDKKCSNEYGEKIILNEAVYLFGKPERGDIVVFKPTKDSDKYFIKRVIGLPNETVTLKDGRVYITDKDGKTFELEEEYLNDRNRNHTDPFWVDLDTFEIPEGHYFMMGDNRAESTDSRSCFSSTISSECKKNRDKTVVKEEDIRGKAIVVWWPFSSMRILHHPEYSESLAEK